MGVKVKRAQQSCTCLGSAGGLSKREAKSELITPRPLPPNRSGGKSELFVQCCVETPATERSRRVTRTGARDPDGFAPSDGGGVIGPMHKCRVIGPGRVADEQTRRGPETRREDRPAAEGRPVTGGLYDCPVSAHQEANQAPNSPPRTWAAPRQGWKEEPGDSRSAVTRAAVTGCCDRLL